MVGALGRDATTAEFLDGAARGELLLRRCTSGHHSEPDAQACTACGSSELSWVAAGGGARLVSWAVKPPRTPTDEPVVLVIAELDEGPWWWSRLLGAAPGTLVADARLRVDTARATAQDEALPVFRLDEPATT